MIDFLEDKITTEATRISPETVLETYARLRLSDGRTALAKRLGRELTLRLPEAVAAAGVLREAGFECTVTV